MNNTTNSVVALNNKYRKYKSQYCINIEQQVRKIISIDDITI